MAIHAGLPRQVVEQRRGLSRGKTLSSIVAKDPFCPLSMPDNHTGKVCLPSFARASTAALRPLSGPDIEGSSPPCSDPRLRRSQGPGSVQKRHSIASRLPDARCLHVAINFAGRRDARPCGVRSSNLSDGWTQQSRSRRSRCPSRFLLLSSDSISCQVSSRGQSRGARRRAPVPRAEGSG